MKHMTLAVVVLFVLSCGTPAEVRRTFPVEVTGALGAGAPNDFGWTVALTQATVQVSSVRFFAGKVLLSRRFDPWSLVVGTAWAHPGHYIPGEALGELLKPVNVDLLATTPQMLGEANATTGDYGSLELTMAAPGIHLAGTATKGGVTVRFDSSAFVPARAIEGIKFDRVLGSETGKVRIALDLADLLARCDFAAAGTVGADGVTVFALDQEAFNGFARGVQDTGAYIVTWEQP